LDQPDFRQVFLLEQEAELQVNLNKKLMMSIYLSRSFPRSNSSFFLCSGNALQSEVLRLREEMFLVDAGPGTPRICMQDEPTGVPINRAARFENKVGSLDVVAGESLIKRQILERFFIDVVAGESLIKERAAARFKNLVGSTDVVAGEPLLLLPRRFRQNRAWMELNKIWRTNTKVRGFFIKKVKGGYSVAIAGFLTFLPFRRRDFSSPRFTIERINLKRKRTNIVVLQKRRIKQELILFVSR
jgi:hypothetical protein